MWTRFLNGALQLARLCRLLLAKPHGFRGLALDRGRRRVCRLLVALRGPLLAREQRTADEPNVVADVIRDVPETVLEATLLEGLVEEERQRDVLGQARLAGMEGTEGHTLSHRSVADCAPLPADRNGHLRDPRSSRAGSGEEVHG